MTDAPTSRTLQGPLSYLSAIHRLSPVEGVTTPASGTPHPRPPLAHWPACQRAGAGLRKSFGGPRPEGQSQGPEQTKIPWSRGPGTGVLSHPAAAAGRRLTGNRKMCTSHCWNTQRDLRRKGEGGGRRRPASCPRGGGPQGVLLRTPHPLAEPRVLPARGWNPAKCAHTSGLGPIGNTNVPTPVCSGLELHLSLPKNRHTALVPVSTANLLPAPAGTPPPPRHFGWNPRCARRFPPGRRARPLPRRSPLPAWLAGSRKDPTRTPDGPLCLPHTFLSPQDQSLGARWGPPFCFSSGCLSVPPGRTDLGKL